MIDDYRVRQFGRGKKVERAKGGDKNQKKTRKEKIERSVDDRV